MPDAAVGKIKRKFMAHFINAALPSASSPVFVRLGNDLEAVSYTHLAQHGQGHDGNRDGNQDLQPGRG